ncbi:SET domain-containing protein [Piedraia hortae CBS 480.64]|uniref:SET domain-containing protein n=1 Tax=Piedraia hortae CBS 480.64 TaxID=1314780 RepID=A0A6A7C2C2_9PEZI|nr:SET domain-containing protein [Piedraia hortae CBS 480.64]
MDIHKEFLAWASAQSVKLHAVHPEHIPDHGIGLVTTGPIKKGDQILHVPSSAMFSSQKPLAKEASPQAQLAASIIISPPDEAWTRTWPAKANLLASLPLFWLAEGQEQLPDATRAVLQRQQRGYERDTKDAAAAGIDVLNNDWDYAWAIVNTRSFHLGKKDMVLCPVTDYINHSPAGQTPSAVAVSQGKDGYRVLATRDYDVGEEVLATYGSHSNDFLLVHYGFIIPSGSYDDNVVLDQFLLPHLRSETRDALQMVGFLGSYVLLPTTEMRWELCFRAQVALRAELSKNDEEWGHFMQTGEDLNAALESKVVKFAKHLTTDFVKHGWEKVSMLESKGAREIVIERWKQILTILTRWTGD